MEKKIPSKELLDGTSLSTLVYKGKFPADKDKNTMAKQARVQAKQVNL